MFRLTLKMIKMFLFFILCVFPFSVCQEVYETAQPNVKDKGNFPNILALEEDNTSYKTIGDSLEKEKREAKSRFAFGLGKKSNVDRFAFGLGKRLGDSRFAFGLGKREPTRYAFGIGKRGDNPRFAFGLGKKSEYDGMGYDNMDGDDALSPDLEETGDKRGDPSRFAFGIGRRYVPYEIGDNNGAPSVGFGMDKRSSSRYSFGIGKREPPRFAFGLGKRPDLTRYAFGIGKRPADPNRFAFGIGKRNSKREIGDKDLSKRGFDENDFEEYIKRRFAFGLGKRSESFYMIE